MELLQLLKTMSDQSSQVDMQEQISRLSEAMVHWIKLSMWLFGILIVLLLAFFIYNEIRFLKMKKRLKKVENKESELLRDEIKRSTEALKEVAKDSKVSKVSK